MSEGIGVELVDFADNRPLLDMFLTKPLGMLALLDEESRFPRATDRTLVGKEAGSSSTHGDLFVPLSCSLACMMCVLYVSFVFCWMVLVSFLLWS